MYRTMYLIIISDITVQQPTYCADKFGIFSGYFKGIIRFNHYFVILNDVTSTFTIKSTFLLLFN
jgi:hypothetical protein